MADCARKTYTDYITLEDVVSSNSIQLRNPNFDDNHNMLTNLNRNVLNDEIAVLFKRDIADVFETKEYSFELLRNYDEIKTWFESYYGNEMQLTDMWGDVWVGTIVSDLEFQDYDYNREDANCKTSLTFTFEGIKQ